MFFFPICHANHFYVVCFDLIRKVCEIIDNSSAAEDADMDPNEKYNGVPEKLFRFFVEYMRANGQPNKVSSFENKAGRLDRLKMPWRNTTNKMDCGIYAMRHMETSKGGGLKKWNSKLKPNNKRQMKYLRAKYCQTILIAERATLKDHV